MICRPKNSRNHLTVGTHYRFFRLEMTKRLIFSPTKPVVLLLKEDVIRWYSSVKLSSKCSQNCTLADVYSRRDCSGSTQFCSLKHFWTRKDISTIQHTWRKLHFLLCINQWLISFIWYNFEYDSSFLILTIAILCILCMFSFQKRWN